MQKTIDDLTLQVSKLTEATQALALAGSREGAAADGAPPTVIMQATDSHDTHNSLSITVNNNVTVPIVPFGDEKWDDASSLVEKVARQPPGDGKGTISLAIGDGWSDPDRPSHWNLAIPNRSKMIPYVCRPEGWVSVPPDEVVPQVVTFACNRLDRAQTSLHDSPYFKVYCARIGEAFREEQRMRDEGTLTKEGWKLVSPHMIANAERLRRTAGAKPGQPLPLEVPILKPPGPCPEVSSIRDGAI